MKCFNCERAGEKLFNFSICNFCKKSLRLFTLSTIEKHVSKFSKKGYLENIEKKLIDLETDFIKKKIKLLDIQSKLTNQ